MNITFGQGGRALTAKEVNGGKEFYQDARREYLEFIFVRDNGTRIEELEELFSGNTTEITLTDPETGESYIHAGYVVRGPIRLYKTEDDSWEIAVRQYRKTEAEAQTQRVAAIVPVLAAQQVAAAQGEAGAMRALAGTIAPVSAMLPACDWAVGMVTQPGDIVYDPQRSYAYLYTGAQAMTHTNKTFYPGAAGVYYWAIIPTVHMGAKVYPDITGIVVAVKQGEIWWSADKTKQYRWTGEDNRACSWYPGQAGVHQWEAVTA